MKKSPRKSLFVAGGIQGPGRGPAKGAPNAGRPPDEFKAFLATLRDSPEFRNRLQALVSADDAIFVKFAQWLTDRTDGKPMQPLSSADGKPLLIVGIA